MGSEAKRQSHRALAVLCILGRPHACNGMNNKVTPVSKMEAVNLLLSVVKPVAT